MTNRRPASLLLFFLLLAAFVSGLVYVFAMRFETGDMYPAYSSYRSDPLGARAFHEALGLLPGIKASRNTGPLGKGAASPGDTTLFLLGLKKDGFFATSPSWMEAVEKAAREGGRVIIAFAPEKGHEIEAPPPGENTNESGGTSAEQQKAAKKTEVRTPAPKNDASPFSRWRVGFGRLPRQQGMARLAATGTGLPPTLDWHSALVFEPGGNEWRTVYARDGKPVVIERTVGKGEIVLLSDSFPLSNEAIKGHRSAALLAWLCGRHDRIVFDETHLGTSDSQGISALLRKEGLVPFFLSLIVLAALAIWRQSAPFVPPPPDGRTRTTEAGRTHRDGMTSLLRRNVPADGLLGVCLDEWERSFTRGPGNLAPLLPQIRGIVEEEQKRPKKERSPVRAYRKVSALVATRRRGWDT